MTPASYATAEYYSGPHLNHRLNISQKHEFRFQVCASSPSSTLFPTDVGVAHISTNNLGATESKSAGFLIAWARVAGSDDLTVAPILIHVQVATLPIEVELSHAAEVLDAKERIRTFADNCACTIAPC